MIANILYFVLALFGIGFLVFIHELGHYFMARKVGITVEVFAIGFGRPILQWDHNGVKWKIGWIPFGGYVKMAGMEKKEGIEPSEISDGYFGAKPWNRIKVSVMGPIINIIFAFLAFSLLWAVGGRMKPFAEFTSYIGRIDRSSNLHKSGIRAGDEITKFNNRPFNGFNDLLYGAALDKTDPIMAGLAIDYYKNSQKPFTYIFPLDDNLTGMELAYQILGQMSPAQYLLYDKLPDGSENPLKPGSPLQDSGITYGDRIIWVDGQLIFSLNQLIKTLNSPYVSLTVERKGKTFLTRVPKLQVRDLIITQNERDEFDDWKNEAKLSQNVGDLAFIPYNLNNQGVVEKALTYIDEGSKKKDRFEKPDRSAIEIPLLPGDRVIGVQGASIDSSYQLLKEIQTPKTQIIVKKTQGLKPLLWKDADQNFRKSFEIKDLVKITQSIGTKTPLQTSGSLQLLKTITPVAFQDFPVSEKQKALQQETFDKQKKAIEGIKNKDQREQAEAQLEKYKNRRMLGIVPQDRRVIYNPSPVTLFGDVFRETYRTLFALFTGHLSPKNIMGPVGIIQVIHHGWSVGVKEALFWLGMISLNLGMLNLMPIPILDGGHICFALWEMITKKPLKAKTMERLIFPFLILLVILFIYLTYNDLSRLISRFF